jgi:hypothetical protein
LWVLHRRKRSGSLCGYRVLFHREQLEKARNIEGKQTDHIWNRIGGVAMQFFNIIILIALGERILRPDEKEVTLPNGRVVLREDNDTVRRKVGNILLTDRRIGAILPLLVIAADICRDPRNCCTRMDPAYFDI